MVIDTSAVVAILLSEPDHQKFSDRINTVSDINMSAASRLESHVVMAHRFGDDAVADLDILCSVMNFQIIPFDEFQLDAARNAYSAYGRGRHPAALNFGDCFSYALAKTRGEPLLFKGTDFQLTDIEPAL